MSAPAWGFVGLGQIGLPMARRLAGAVDLLAHDRAVAAAPGLRCTADPAALAGCDVVVTCLPDGAAVAEFLFGPDGLAARLAPGATVIDCSTTSHAAAVEAAQRLERVGIGFLDAPVTGMAARAETGDLTMMVGGSAALLERHHAGLSAMAGRIEHMGAVGSGQLAKLINQLLFDINAAALAEIMPIAARMGLDPAQITGIVNSGSGRSFASETFLPAILQGRFDRGYPMQAAYKDLIAGAELTARHGLPAPVLAAATATYQQALARGLGAQDKGAMIKLFEEMAGVAFRARGGAPDQGPS